MFQGLDLEVEDAAGPLSPQHHIAQTHQDKHRNKPAHGAANQLNNDGNRQDREEPITGDKLHASLIKGVFCKGDIDKDKPEPPKRFRCLPPEHFAFFSEIWAGYQSAQMIAKPAK